MATKKTPPQPPTKKRRTSTKEPLSMEPAETVPMTDEQCRDTIQVLVPLVDSYVARHRDDPPSDPPGELPPLVERHDLLAQAVAVWQTRPEPRLRYQEEKRRPSTPRSATTTRPSPATCGPSSQAPCLKSCVRGGSKN